MFILSKDFDDENPRDFPYVDVRYEEYRKYLDSISDKLLSSAREFALADWRLDFMDHKCPYKSWVKQLKLFKEPTDEQKQEQILQIETRLLSAYRDGYLDLKYKKVNRYSLVKSSSWYRHWYWIYDEIRLSENGLVLHEIEFSNQTNWLIECEDIEFIWTPLES